MRCWLRLQIRIFVPKWWRWLLSSTGYSTRSLLSGLYLLFAELMNITDSRFIDAVVLSKNIINLLITLSRVTWMKKRVDEGRADGAVRKLSCMNTWRCWPYDQSIYRSKLTSVLSPQADYFEGTSEPATTAILLVTSSCFVIHKSHILDIHSLPVPYSLPS